MRARVALPLLGMIAVLLVSGAAQAHHYRPIQPGAFLDPPGGSLNFVFRDADDVLYIGTAGHNIGMGARAHVRQVGEFGTVVYRRNQRGAEFGAMDFALIAIDVDKYDLVDPSVRHWGGPLGVETGNPVGTITLNYSQAAGVAAAEPLRARVGQLQRVKTEQYWGEYRGWYTAVHPASSGDSGGPMVTGEGMALGVITTLALGDRATVAGPTIALVLEELSGAGFELELVTAPFTPPSDADAALGRTGGMLAHCLDHPVSTPTDGDACLRPEIHGSNP